MKRYYVEYQFVDRNGRLTDEYDNENHLCMESVSENTLNRLKALFWVKILSVTPCNNTANMV